VSQATVRKANADDVDAIVRGYEWLFEHPGARPPRWNTQRAAAALSAAISSASAGVFVATDDDEIVGLCTAYDDIDSVRFGRRVWVEDLAVHPQHRSRGIGKQLLDEAKRWARERRASRLQLDSSELRKDAHRFYEREHPDWRSLSFGWWL
jgi:GNAT superfamily N-acetyltransferase